MMKKVAFAIAALFLTVSTGFAQRNTFNDGDKVVSFGLGIGSTVALGSYYDTKVPPISFTYEQGIMDGLLKGKASIGAGGIVGYTKSEYNYHAWGYTGWYNTESHFVLGGRGAFHYQLVDKLDTYAGLTLGYDFVSYENSNNKGDLNGSGLWTSEFVGARYYFSDNFACFSELGYGFAYLTFGVSLKF